MAWDSVDNGPGDITKPANLLQATVAVTKREAALGGTTALEFAVERVAGAGRVLIPPPPG